MLPAIRPELQAEAPSNAIAVIRDMRTSAIQLEAEHHQTERMVDVLKTKLSIFLTVIPERRPGKKKNQKPVFFSQKMQDSNLEKFFEDPASLRRLRRRVQAKLQM